MYNELSVSIANNNRVTHLIQVIASSYSAVWFVPETTSVMPRPVVLESRYIADRESERGGGVVSGMW